MEIVEFLMAVIFAMLGMIIGYCTIALYLLPGIIATIRHHNNSLPIWLLTVLMGWTTIGWVIALVWSFTDNIRGKKC